MRETVHGYPVIASYRTPADRCVRAGAVILVQKKNEFVTAWLGDGDYDWTWGHYFATEEAAREDFRERCARGF